MILFIFTGTYPDTQRANTWNNLEFEIFRVSVWDSLQTQAYGKEHVIFGTLSDCFILNRVFS